jgi:hypothetical protein
LLIRRAFKIAAWGVVIAASSVALLIVLSWSKRHIDWFVPAKSAILTVDGLTQRNVQLFVSAGTPFTLPPDRTLVLIENIIGQKQTYVILGPGPGHLSEGFKGSIRRCESVFVATPLFGFANDRSDCVAPDPNRDENRHARFDIRSVEFTDDEGRREEVDW